MILSWEFTPNGSTYICIVESHSSCILKLLLIITLFCGMSCCVYGSSSYCMILYLIYELSYFCLYFSISHPFYFVGRYLYIGNVQVTRSRRFSSLWRRRSDTEHSGGTE